VQHLTLAALIDSTRHSNKPTLSALLQRWLGPSGFSELSATVGWLSSNGSARLEVTGIAHDCDGLELITYVENLCGKSSELDTSVALLCRNEAHIEYLLCIGNIPVTTGVRFLTAPSDPSNTHNRLTTDLSFAYATGLRQAVKDHGEDVKAVSAVVKAKDKTIAAEIERRKRKKEDKEEKSKEKKEKKEKKGGAKRLRTTETKTTLPAFAAARDRLLCLLPSLPVKGSLRLVFNIDDSKGHDVALWETELNGDRTDIIVTFTRASLRAFTAFMEPKYAQILVDALNSFYRT